MEALLTKPMIVAFALLGAALSVVASVLRKGGPARCLNAAGYAAMAVSMLLFAIAGLWGMQP